MHWIPVAANLAPNTSSPRPVHVLHATFGRAGQRCCLTRQLQYEEKIGDKVVIFEFVCDFILCLGFVFAIYYPLPAAFFCTVPAHLPLFPNHN
jgi:hypothetical protein